MANRYRAGGPMLALIAGALVAAPPAQAQDESFTWTMQTAYAAGDDLHLSYVHLAEKIEAMSGAAG